jgi:hypothetical protein
MNSAMGILGIVALAVGLRESIRTRRHKDIVELTSLPPAVSKSAQAEHPDMKFETAWKTAEGHYEVRGKANTGKIYDVKVSETGQVLEVDFDLHPENIQVRFLTSGYHYNCTSRTDN